MYRPARVQRRAAGVTEMDENPYEYSLDAFLDVPQEYMRYAEETAVDVSIEAPSSIAIGPDGRLFVAGERAVEVFSADGKSAAVWTLEASATAVAVAADSTVFVALADHVEVCNSDGSSNASWTALGENALITGLAAAGENVFAADFDSTMIWRFDRSGKLLGLIGSSDAASPTAFLLPSPYFDIAVGHDGGLWAANPGRLRVEERNLDGTPKRSFGRPSMRIDGFCGCCNPTHITVDAQGRVFTSEKGLPRVKVYNADGSLRAVVAGPKQFEEGTVGLDLAVSSSGTVYVLDPKRGVVRVFSLKSDKSEGL